VLHSIPVPSRLFTHREFAFTLGESTYVRYNSFNNVEDFKKEILRVNPTRFEIGPIYNVRVSVFAAGPCDAQLCRGLSVDFPATRP
jgi:DNA primase catalytic subunit